MTGWVADARRAGQALPLRRPSDVLLKRKNAVGEGSAPPVGMAEKRYRVVSYVPAATHPVGANCVRPPFRHHVGTGAASGKVASPEIPSQSPAVTALPEGEPRGLRSPRRLQFAGTPVFPKRANVTLMRKQNIQGLALPMGELSAKPTERVSPFVVTPFPGSVIAHQRPMSLAVDSVGRQRRGNPFPFSSVTRDPPSDIFFRHH